LDAIIFTITPSHRKYSMAERYHEPKTTDMLLLRLATSEISQQMVIVMSETQDRQIRFRCGFRIHPIIWASLAFVVTFMVSAVFMDVFFGQNHPMLTSYVVLSGTFLIPALIRDDPRPAPIDSGSRLCATGSLIFKAPKRHNHVVQEDSEVLPARQCDHCGAILLLAACRGLSTRES
jgi:hypothetical protein